VFYTLITPCVSIVTMYLLCFRAKFLSSDGESGVFKLEIKLHIKTPGKPEYMIFHNFTKSARGVRM